MCPGVLIIRIVVIYTVPDISYFRVSFTALKIVQRFPKRPVTVRHILIVIDPGGMHTFRRRHQFGIHTIRFLPLSGISKFEIHDPRKPVSVIDRLIRDIEFKLFCFGLCSIDISAFTACPGSQSLHDKDRCQQYHQQPVPLHPSAQRHTFFLSHSHSFLSPLSHISHTRSHTVI